jgi:hypothetical protein
MDRNLLDHTIAYVLRELTRINQDLTWADGAQAESYRTRQLRLEAELDRLEALRRGAQLTPRPLTPRPLN